MIAFSGIEPSINKIKTRKPNPNVYLHEACQTIENIDGDLNHLLNNLCKKYGPKDYESAIPRLGYGGYGALISFSHGIPNNAPRLLFSKGKKWMPLYRGRSVNPRDFGSIKLQHERNMEILRNRYKDKLSSISDDLRMGHEKMIFFLVISALRKKPRTLETVSSRSGLTISECGMALDQFLKAGWIDAQFRPTEQARRELSYLSYLIKPKRKQIKLSSMEDLHYSPTQLRMPK